MKRSRCKTAVSAVNADSDLRDLWSLLIQDETLLAKENLCTLHLYVTKEAHLPRTLENNCQAMEKSSII